MCSYFSHSFESVLLFTPQTLSLDCLIPCYVIPENSLKLRQTTIFPGKTWIHIGKIFTLMPTGIFFFGNLEYHGNQTTIFPGKTWIHIGKIFKLMPTGIFFLGNLEYHGNFLVLIRGLIQLLLLQKKYQLASCIEHYISVSI